MKQRGIVSIDWRCPDESCNQHNTTELDDILAEHLIEDADDFCVICVCRACNHEVEVLL